MTLLVTAYLADNSTQEFPQKDSFYDQLLALEIEGYSGMQIIQELLTDDWGRPLQCITISGNHKELGKISKTVPYE